MGNHVLGLDLDAGKVKALNAGRIPIFEPGWRRSSGATIRLRA
jgi:UDP-glucose 6-dehydrogenase